MQVNRFKLKRLLGLSIAVLFLSAALLSSLSHPVQAADLEPGYVQGIPWTGAMGITETTEQIMARQAERDKAGIKSPRRIKVEHEMNPLRQANPNSPKVARFGRDANVNGAPSPKFPFTQGVVFNGPDDFNDSLSIPPDTDGDIGPTQFIVAVNGRIRSYTRAGAADGKIDVETSTFFFSVINGSGDSDPTLHYDRLTQRWFLTEINVDTPNRVMIAVSNSSTVNSATAWTFFYFQQELVTPAGDSTCLFDYPTTGIDANALYIGGNQFCGQFQTFAGGAAFVVRKSSVLGAGPIVVTAFRGLTQGYPNPGSNPGIVTPRGVDSPEPDPSGTAPGYFIGDDNAFLGIVNIRRVANPAGIPSISPDLVITVPINNVPLPSEHKGNDHPGGTFNGKLDSSDQRFMQATRRNGSLWTSQSTAVNGAGIANTGADDRNATRWYQFTNLGTTPTIVQAGTVFDPTPTNALNYNYGSVLITGQGHAVFGMTAVGPLSYADAATTSRLASDPAGYANTPEKFSASTSAYTPSFDTGVSRPRRWGDWSTTRLDPCDDMTAWTSQEFTRFTDYWGVRVAQLKAPPPATISSASPATVGLGQASVNVTINGVFVNGSGFYDTPSTLTDPCRKRLAVTISRGVTVNSITYVNPSTILLNISTVGATAGTPTITITNPDGQSTSGTAFNLGTSTAHLWTAGVFFNGVFYLRNSNSAGPADIITAFGSASMLPVTGDWNGDGVDSIGVYDSSTGVFFLSNSNTTPAVNYNFVLGNPGDTPIAGKWDNTMSAAGAGVFRPSNGLIYVKRNLVTGFADYTMVLGNPGDAAVSGDWDGNGFASIGVFRPSQARFYLSNTVTNGIVFGDFSFVFGTSTSKPVAGDWTGVGAAHVGIFLNGAFYLRNAFTTGPADIAFFFGPAAGYPIAGRWIAGPVPPSSVLAPPSNAAVPPATSVPNTTTPNNSGGRFD